MFRLLVLGLVVAKVGYLVWQVTQEPPLPYLDPNPWWGPGNPRPEDMSIKSFKINIPKQDVDDLKARLALPLRLTPALEGANFTYGFSDATLKAVVKHWRTTYDWKKREARLNSYPHFKTHIEGLDIHFLRAAAKADPGVTVLPLLLVHGWPGSVVEFYNILPLLTMEQEGSGVAFEVICPSIPGYGFSQASAKQGLGVLETAQIFLKLMKRLGYQQFYTQGGDLGSRIVTAMGTLYPDNVLGVHVNMVVANTVGRNLKYFLGSVLPAGLLVDKEDQHKLYPISEKVIFVLQETGYMHIQATKPDTTGAALNQHPVSLAVYILEKFSTGTNRNNPHLPDGGLLQPDFPIPLDEMLDNVCVYWFTGSITSSQRYYKENLRSFRLPVDDIPCRVPAGFAVFPHEAFGDPKNFMAHKFYDIVTYRNIMVVLAAARVEQGKTEEIHPRALSCMLSDTNTTLRCNATSVDSNKLIKFNWESLNKVIVDNKDKKIQINEPICVDANIKREVQVHNSAEVTTEEEKTNCTQQLVLYSCKNVRITDGVDLVRMFNSEADEISLPSVRQLDLNNSNVSRLSVEIKENRSTIEDSQIDLVKKLIVNGPFKFMVTRSKLIQVEDLLYNSLHEATFNDVQFGSVTSTGFQVQNGKVVIQDSSIDNIGANGLSVESNAELVLINTVLHTVVYNSILAKKNSKVIFENVTVADRGEIYFSISDANANYLPLQLLEQFSYSQAHGWMALYLCIGLLLGVLSGAGVTCYRFRRLGKFKNEAETTELIVNESRSLPPQRQPQNNKRTPLPPERPLPNLPPSGAKAVPVVDDEYVKYVDVAPNVMAPRPPVAVPDESSTSEGCKPHVSGSNLAVPNLLTLRDHKGSEKTDDRDNLPPPPVPSDENDLYDDLAVPAPRPQPPPAVNKPKGPPMKKRPLPHPPFRKF